MEASQEAIEDFAARSRLFGQHGRGKNKSLDMFAAPVFKRIWFVVTDHRVDVYNGLDLKEAISIYNKL